MIIKSYNLTNVSQLIPTINQVILMYINGSSAKVISKRTDMAVGDVYKILQDNNIPLRKGNSNAGIKILRDKSPKKIEDAIEIVKENQESKEDAPVDTVDTSLELNADEALDILNDIEDNPSANIPLGDFAEPENDEDNPF